MNTDFALVYVPCANADEARRIGTQLVTERLAACVNILPAMQSIYWWEGQVTHGDEALLLAKTLTGKIHLLNDRVKSLHSYTTPAIAAVPLLHLDPEFAKWLEESLETP